MLAAVCLTAPRRRWLSRRRRPPEVRAEFVPAGSGRYVKITAETGKDGAPDWSAIRRTAGREATRLLLPGGVVPPPDSRVGRFAGAALDRRLMENAGVALLQAVGMHPRLVQVGVYDPQGVCPELPLRFLPLAADVRVCTRRPDRYARSRFVAMERFGAALTVADAPSALTGSLLLLAPSGLPDPVGVPSAKGLALVVPPPGMSPVRSMGAEKGTADGYRPRIPPALAAACPPGCEVEGFLAGLYELSGVKELAEGPPEFLRIDGRRMSLKDAAWRLAGLDIGISV